MRNDPANPPRFPGYDVQAKRRTPSWNEKTRQVIDARLAVPRDPHFFTEDEFRTVQALAARIVPQRPLGQEIPVAALVDHKLHEHKHDGYRRAGTKQDGEAWKDGLYALDAECERRHRGPFRDLPHLDQDALLQAMQEGELTGREWGDMPAKAFFTHRMGRDLVMAFYSHPDSWSRMGFGGPASPRGYVRMGYDERDPWEAAEIKGDDTAMARKLNDHVG